MILYNVVPRVSVLCRSWATKEARPSTISWTCKFSTSQLRRGNNEEDKDGRIGSATSAQTLRNAGRKRKKWLTDEQRELLTRLQQTGISTARIKREHFPDVPLYLLYEHADSVRGTVWTEADDQRLMSLRSMGKTTAEIRAEAFPQRTVPIVKFRIARLLAQNPDMRNDLQLRRYFDHDNIEQLRRLHGLGVTAAEIAKVLGLSCMTVERKIHELKLGLNSTTRASCKRWTQAEDESLRPYLAIRFSGRHFETLTQTASWWRRTFHNTENRLVKLRRDAEITRDWHRWSSEDLELALRSRADGMTWAQIGEKLGRKTSEVEAKLRAIP